jgi:membrane protease YdiL (CAAX protease family)
VVSTVFVIVQVIAIIVWSAIFSLTGAGISAASFAEQVTMNGDLVAIGALATGIVCSALVYLLAMIKSGSRPGESLGLKFPTVLALAKWIALTIGLIIISDVLTLKLGKPIVPEFMTEIVHSASVPALLWAAIIVAAPFFEELFVRGFLLEGLRRGSLGDAGAIVITSLFWASIHLQYGMYEIGTIFIFGLVLGLARIGSRSLWVPIAMHMLANLVATVEAHAVTG